MIVEVALDCLAKVVFVSFHHYNVTPFSSFPHCTLWKEVTLRSSHLRYEELCPLLLLCFLFACFVSTNLLKYKTHP